MGEHAIVSNYEMSEYGLMKPWAGQDLRLVAVPSALSSRIAAPKVKGEFRGVVRESPEWRRLAIKKKQGFNGQGDIWRELHTWGREISARQVGVGSGLCSLRHLPECGTPEVGVIGSVGRAVQERAKYANSYLQHIRNAHDEHASSLDHRSME